MPSSPSWLFAPFRLDPDNACLWREAEAIPLTPKAYGVLHYLVTHPDRLVTKEELLDAVWPETAVTDVVVRIAVGELRKLLGDTTRTPRFIATVHRRGYRFLVPVTMERAAEPGPADTVPTHPRAPMSPPPGLLVEREAVLQRLHEAWDQACHGQRQVVLVTGEAGIGKTAMIEAFVADATTVPEVRVAQGQCVEHYGTGEAYLPVLEALEQLCRAPQAPGLVAVLRQQAPTWLVQMPWLLTDGDRERLHYELHGATRERMLREFATAVETLTAETPLILVLEDLHWSDYATLDLLALLARRRTPARLLILGTYRPVDAIVQGHPLRTITQDLSRHGHAVELPLALLSAEAVAAYLAVRFPQQQFPATLAARLHHMTDGNPLFLLNVLAAWSERGMLVERDGCWVLQEALDTAVTEVPENLRQMLDQQFERLPSAAQSVLEVASAVGVEFTAAAVAAGLETDIMQVETDCEALVRLQQFLQPAGVVTWPDGTVTARYRFGHGLYQQVAYQRLGRGQRLRLHQRLGTRMEAAYGANARQLAAELAMHFTRGQDTTRAIYYLRQAAENAAQRYAPYAVISALTQALELLERLPDTAERAQHELHVQLALGVPLIEIKGTVAPEVAQTYARAHELSQQVGETAQRSAALLGLATSYNARGKFQLAQHLGQQALRLAQQSHDAVAQARSHFVLGNAMFYLGELLATREHLEQSKALYESQQHRFDSFLSPVFCLIRLGQVLWYLGYPDQALQHSQEALRLALALVHPTSIALALSFSAGMHQYRREIPQTRALAEAAMADAHAQQFQYRLAQARVLYGWALTMQGQGQAGIVQLRQGLEGTGVEATHPHRLGLLAEAYNVVGQSEAGLQVVQEALTLASANRWPRWEVELYRLKGELMLQASAQALGSELCEPSSASASPSLTEAEACFHHSLTMARHQQAKSLELRAALCLSRLWQRQGKLPEARQLLAEIYGWFSEGFDTADLQEARALLADLEGGCP